MKIPIKKLSPEAKVPTRGTPDSAGYDLYFAEEDKNGSTICAFIHPGKRELCGTGIAVSIPSGHYGRIAPRSGLAAKHGIQVLGGVIDADYRGEIKVILHNTSDKAFTVNKGDKIAQLVIERCYPAEFIEFDSLEETERGQGGFGSTDHPQPAAQGK